MLNTAIVPVACRRIEVPGTITFTAACFAGDWGLGPLQEPEDANRHPDLAERLGEALCGLGVHTALAPNPTTFNAAIVPPATLIKSIPLSGGVVLRRNKAAPADGSFLEMSEAGVFSAGGCPILVAASGDRLCFAHAGRDSILDRKRIETQGEHAGRAHEGVAYAALDSLEAYTAADLKDVHAYVFWSIRPEEYYFSLKDLRWSGFNDALLTYVLKRFGERSLCVNSTGDGFFLDLPEILAAQLRERGVPPRNISLKDAYLPEGLPHTRNGNSAANPGRRRSLLCVARTQ